MTYDASHLSLVSCVVSLVMSYTDTHTDTHNHTHTCIRPGAVQRATVLYIDEEDVFHLSCINNNASTPATITRVCICVYVCLRYLPHVSLSFYLLAT